MGSFSFSIDGSYKLSYKSTIKGKISKNKLCNLEGVKVKILFLWEDIVEVCGMILLRLRGGMMILNFLLGDCFGWVFC